ncbi:hypothetical protein BGZ82_005202 [Podila clonocystis]|nr:hypothetical protein BGZ82_005202 [Podila clonocystis]
MGQRSLPKQPSPTKKPLPDALAAIQDKLVKDQPKIGGYLSRMGVKPMVAVNTGHTSTDKKASTSSSKPTIPKAMSTTAARNSTGNKGSAKSRKEPALVSIADKIPRGSRAKPIPPKQAQSPLQSAGSISPSPSTPLPVKDDTSQSTEDDLVFIQPSPSQHSKSSAPLVARPRQTREQPQTIVLSSSPPDSENDSDLEYDIAETKEPSDETGNMVREPSILTIESSKTFSIASDIPSIEVDAIERWVGGVQQALDSDDDDDETAAIRASNLVPGTTNTINSTRPSTVARPVTHGVIEIDSSPPHVIPSTFDDQEVEPVSGKDERSHPQTPQMGRQARVLAPDSLSWTASAPRNLRTGSSVSPVKGSHVQDDISTIVGGQPTQDTFGLRSIASFVSDRENLERAIDEQERGQEQAALPSGLTSSCLQELGLLKRRTSDNSSPRKRRTSAGWNSELGSDPIHEDLEEDMMMAQRGYFPSSFGAAPSTMSPLSYNYGLASIDEDSPKYQPMARLRHDVGQTQSGEDGESGDFHDGSRDRSYPSVESMRGQESYVDFHRRILADSRVHVLDDSQPSLPSMPSMTGLSTLPSLPSIPSIPTLPSFSSMPSSAAFHEQEPTQEP